MNIEELIEKLKDRGYRITKQRESILRIIIQADKPLTPLEIIRGVQKENTVDKATIYRNLEFLIENSILKEIYFNDNYIRYELAGQKHHHHIVCKNCHQIIPIELKEVEEILKTREKEIKKKYEFNEIDHSIEFFGTCNNCIHAKD